ncbi:MAG: hypothetical protein ABSG60_12350 [Terracidiphilus sp.]|jgi:hypothetical protein|nr:hypothetical protein [Terracidiphilus sp.]
MKKKTMLLIAAWIESLFGAYFVLAFVAWFAKLFLFSTSPAYYGALLIVPAALSVGCYALFNITIRKYRDTDAK